MSSRKGKALRFSTPEMPRLRHQNLQQPCSFLTLEPRVDSNMFKTCSKPALIISHEANVTEISTVSDHQMTSDPPRRTTSSRRGAPCSDEDPTPCVAARQPFPATMNTYENGETIPGILPHPPSNPNKCRSRKPTAGKGNQWETAFLVQQFHVDPCGMFYFHIF